MLRCEEVAGNRWTPLFLETIRAWELVRKESSACEMGVPFLVLTVASHLTQEVILFSRASALSYVIEKNVMPVYKRVALRLY